MNMKKFAFLFFSLLLSCTIQAQTASQVLDRCASVIGHRSGASASFGISSKKYGSTSGTIAIKGDKFRATTPQVIVWYNGKTQWSYMKKTREVNISNPTEAQQMSMNPYTFIHIYKTGYRASLKKYGADYIVHLIAVNQKRTVQELYLAINRNSYIPRQIRMRQGTVWSTITVNNFRSKDLPNSLFSFNSKDYPQAEVIDLR
jgi:outer membrane lipoprotein-sorting protein